MISQGWRSYKQSTRFPIHWIHSWELRVVIAVDVRRSFNMKTSTMTSTLCFFFILSSFLQFSDAFVSNQVGRRSSKVGIEYFLFHLWEIVISMATFSTDKMDFSELCLKFGGITFTSEQWDLLYKQYFPPYYKLFFDYLFSGSLVHWPSLPSVIYGEYISTVQIT